MSYPQPPPVPGSSLPPAGGWPAQYPAQYQQQPHQGQSQWQQAPQQQPQPFPPYHPQQQQQQQQQQQPPPPGPHTYGQPYQAQPPRPGPPAPLPLGGHPTFSQSPAGSPGHGPASAPGTASPGPGGSPHSAGFAPGVGGPANAAPHQGYPAQGHQGPASPPPGSLMGQVNQAIASGKPYIQTFSSKLSGKFGRLTGHASTSHQPPAPGMYGQPGGYGPAAYGHPQQQPGQPPLQSPPIQSPPPHQQQPSPYGHPQQQPGQPPVQSPPPHQQQPGPYGQSPSPYPPGPAAVPPPPAPSALAQAADPLAHSMGALSLNASSATSTPPPHAAPTAAPAPPPPPPSQKWCLVEPISQQPTSEFRALAALMFGSLNGQDNQKGFVDAAQILGAWQANGLDRQWVDLFAYDNYYSFSVMWSLSQIPHVLVPKTPSLVPPAASLGTSPPGAAATIPADPGSSKFDGVPLPVYVPALTVGGYTGSLYLDFFDDPASLPDLVRKQIGAESYADLRLRDDKLPDLDAYDPSVPADLQSRAKAVRAAAVERAMAEVARRMSAGPAAAPVS